MMLRYSVLAGVLLFVAGSAFGHENADPSQSMPSALRAWYSADQSDWPEPDLDDSVDARPLAALPLNPPAAARTAIESAQVELGKRLFFEPLLSASGQHACASCHDPDLGWADGRRFSFGHDRQRGELNSPTILNAGFLSEVFWDGRAASLEEQAMASILNPVEMAGEPQQLVTRLQSIEGYRDRFAEAFPGQAISFARVASAIAAFARVQNTPNTAFDRFMRGDRTALDDQALWGLHLFRTKARCLNCHSGALLSDGKYHHLGTSFYGVGNFQGRYAVTTEKPDFSAFRTAPLRNVSATAPYMHNGLLDSLDHVLASYNMGWWQNSPSSEAANDPRFAKLSPLIKPLNLSKDELVALKAFLTALGSGGSKTEPPQLPR